MGNPSKVKLNFNDPVTGVAGNVEGNQIIQVPNPINRPSLEVG